MNQITTQPENRKTDLSASDNLLTAKDVADILGVKIGWIYERTNPKHPEHVPCVRIGPRLVRFMRSDIQDWLKARGV